MIRRTTWILIAVFAVSLLVVFAWLQSQSNQSEVATPTVGDDFLFDTKGMSVVCFKISSSEGQNSQQQSLIFEKDEDDKWILVEPAGEQVDSARIDPVLSAIERMRVVATLESEIEKELIALDPPAFTLEFELENGEIQAVFIGDQTPTQDGYYAYKDGESLIVLSGYSIVPLLELLTDPPITRTPMLSPTP